MSVEENERENRLGSCWYRVVTLLRCDALRSEIDGSSSTFGWSRGWASRIAIGARGALMDIGAYCPVLVYPRQSSSEPLDLLRLIDRLLDEPAIAFGKTVYEVENVLRSQRSPFLSEPELLDGAKNRGR
jgi:hypothetical protein